MPRKWSRRGLNTSYLNSLLRSNWQRGAVARDLFEGLRGVAPPRSYYASRDAVYDGVPGRAELNLRINAHEPLMRVTKRDLVQRMLALLEAAGTGARVGNTDV